MTGITIDDFALLLNTSNNILMYNSEIENSITTNGGTILYSYNNIIIASEISDSLFFELQKSPYIDFLQDLPLKKYGDIDINLINQISTFDIDINGLNTSGALSGVENLSGSSIFINNGYSPIIINSILTISALTNTWFNFPILVSGSTPLYYEYTKPPTFNGELIFKNVNILSGYSSQIGTFNIELKVTNDFGYDVKNLILTVSELTKITNSNLDAISKIGSQFSYIIESSGPYPKYYDVNNLPSELILTQNIISGIFTTGGTYIMNIIVSGLTNSDSKTLTISVDSTPIITSPGEISVYQNSGLSYQITSNPSNNVSYNVIGILPSGLKFSVDTISGIPTIPGIYFLTIKATSAFGQSIKQLKINILNI